MSVVELDMLSGFPTDRTRSVFYFIGTICDLFDLTNIPPITILHRIQRTKGLEQSLKACFTTSNGR